MNGTKERKKMYKTIENIIDYVSIKTGKDKEHIEIQLIHYVTINTIKGSRADLLELCKRYTKDTIKEHYNKVRS